VLQRPRIQRGNRSLGSKSPKDQRWYYVIDTPLFRPDGNISKFGMIVDIHQRKEAEQELERHRCNLEERVRSPDPGPHPDQRTPAQ
jgi:hypothetical protein